MKPRIRDTNATLLIGFGLLLVLMFSQMALSVYEVLTLRGQLDKVVSDKLVKSELAWTMFDASRERALLLTMIYYEEDPFERDELQMRFYAHAERFMVARDRLHAMNLSEAEEKALTDALVYATSAASGINQALELMMGNDDMTEEQREQAAALLREKVVPARAKVSEKMIEIGWMAREGGEQSVRDAEENYDKMWVRLWLLGGAILLVSGSIIWTVYHRIMRSSTQIHEMYHELDHVASHDSLTGLYNRRTFEERFDQILERAKGAQIRVALLYLDLDGFKAVNDDLGHHSGDEVLQWFSNHMRYQVRDGDLVARLGGDEFAIVLNNIVNQQRAAEVTQRILEQTSIPLLLEGGEQVDVGVSIGVALYPDDGEDQESLLHQADVAMYQAKRSGCNSVQFSQQPAPPDDIV